MIKQKKIKITLYDYEQEIDIIFALVNTITDTLIYSPTSRFFSDLDINIAGPIVIKFNVDMIKQPDIIDTMSELDLLNSKQRKAILNRRKKSKRPILTSVEFSLYLIKQMISATMDGTHCKCQWYEQEPNGDQHIETIY